MHLYCDGFQARAGLIGMDGSPAAVLFSGGTKPIAACRHPKGIGLADIPRIDLSRQSGTGNETAFRVLGPGLPDADGTVRADPGIRLGTTALRRNNSRSGCPQVPDSEGPRMPAGVHATGSDIATRRG